MNDRATTGPGSDRSLILVATVLLCDGLEMTEQGRCYDFEAEYRTEPMSLNERTGDVGANTNQTATGIYSGEQSESNLKNKYGEDNIFAYADASIKSHECKAVWLAFIFVILVLVILSETLKCEYKCSMNCEDDDILEQGRVSQSIYGCSHIYVVCIMICMRFSTV